MRGRAIILRGIPGSGKSTLARELVKDGGLIHSTDNYFVGTDGIFRFDSTLLERYHRDNYLAFCRSMRRGVPLVVCDNTNISRADYLRYLKSAQYHKYETEIIVLPKISVEEALARNTHGVPREKIQEMLNRWEE